MPYPKSLSLVALTIVCFLSVGCDLVGKKMPDAETFFKESRALALAKAIENGDVGAIHQLATEVDINQQHTRGMTFLNWAFSHQQFDSARALISHHADPNIATENVSPLELAMKLDDIRWLKLLVEAGADINRKKQSAPLWFGTYLAHNWSHMDYLLEKGVDVNATDGAGYSAIMELGLMEMYGQVLKLVAKGADIAIQTPTGLSFAYIVQEHTVPKSSREYKNREKIVQLLQSKGIYFPVPSPKEVKRKSG